MRQLLLFIVAGAVCSGTAVAAVQQTPISIDDLAAKASVAGVASVQSIVPRVNPANNMVYTDFVLKFSDVWKGEPGDPFPLTRTGGKVGDRTVSLPGYEFNLKVGEPIAVFASDNHLGDHVIIGIHQGVFRIEPGSENFVHRVNEARFERQAPMTLLSLREQVFRATGRPWTDPPKVVFPPKPSQPVGAPGTADPVTGSPTAPAAAVPPQMESRGSSIGMILVGLVILAAVVAVFVLRSKAEPKNSR